MRVILEFDNKEADLRDDTSRYSWEGKEEFITLVTKALEAVGFKKETVIEMWEKQDAEV